jgi:uncharacterized repeat protein (TIGR01451 family)/MYXO-CTERM domain-containing protein
VTTVGLSSAAGQLDNGQTTAVLRATTTGDSFVPTAAGFAIDVNAPSFADAGNVASAAPLELAIGESSTVTVDMHNGGLVDATDVVFRIALPTGLELASFTIDGVAGDVDGNPVDTAGLEAGVAVGDVTVGQSKQLVLEVTATAPPAMGNTWTIVPQWEYDYVSCVGEPPLTEPHGLAPIFIDYDPTGSGSGSGSGDGSASASGGLDDTAGEGSGADSASGGGSAGASGDGSGAATDGSADGTGPGGMSFSASDGTGSGSEDGCGCRTDRRPGAGWSWLLLLAPLAARRRRVRPAGA